VSYEEVHVEEEVDGEEAKEKEWAEESPYLAFEYEFCVVV